MTNIKEFEALAARYETITLAEIVSKGMNLKELTGFGNNKTCTLCQSVKDGAGDVHCKFCTWLAGSGDYCTIRANKNTFVQIETAETAPDLIKAYRARAKRMRDVLAAYQKKQEQTQ